MKMLIKSGVDKIRGQYQTIVLCVNSTFGMGTKLDQIRKKKETYSQLNVIPTDNTATFVAFQSISLTNIHKKEIMHHYKDGFSICMLSRMNINQ